MSTLELTTQINELRELESMMDELKAEIETIKDNLKGYLDSLGVSELTVGTHIIRYTDVTSNRLDTTALKRENNSIYLRYLKQVTSRRFSIA